MMKARFFVLAGIALLTLAGVAPGAHAEGWQFYVGQQTPHAAPVKLVYPGKIITIRQPSYKERCDHGRYDHDHGRHKGRHDRSDNRHGHDDRSHGRHGDSDHGYYQGSAYYHSPARYYAPVRYYRVW